MAWRRARSAGGSGSAMRRSAHTSGRLAASWERIPWSTPSSRRETWSWSARPLSRIGLVEERPQPKPEKVRMCLQGPQQRNAVKPPHVVLADHHNRVTPTHHLESLLVRSEEHTSELQSPCNLVCRLLLEKKNKN